MRFRRRETVELTAMSSSGHTIAALKISARWLKPPKLTNRRAPLYMLLVYMTAFVCFVLNSFLHNSTWAGFAVYMVAIFTLGVGYNYGSAALRKCIRLEGANYATRTASGSGYYPSFPTGIAGGIPYPVTGLARAGTAEDPGVTETTADVPIIASKLARLVFAGPGQWSLIAINSGTPILADDTARCVAGPGAGTDHESPVLDCTCGFYAVKANAADVVLGYGGGTVPMTVELSGRVIVHESGYRGQYQRVLSVDLPCPVCGLAATHAYLNPIDRNVWLACDEHLIHADTPLHSVLIDELIAALAPLPVNA